MSNKRQSRRKNRRERERVCVCVYKKMICTVKPLLLSAMNRSSSSSRSSSIMYMVWSKGRLRDAPLTPYFICAGMEDKINLMRLLPHFSF